MVDYSKWNNIEVSDDEDDTHPNIDTPSLFRWRHQARVDRMAEAEQVRQTMDAKLAQNRDKLKDVEEQLKKTDGEDKEKAKKKKAELKKQKDTLAEDDATLKKKERMTAWNVDTLSKPGFEKSVLNKSKPDEDTSEETWAERYGQFVVKNEKLVKKFAMFSRPDDSELFLKENNHLACEHAASYLAIWCVDLCVQKKLALLKRVAKQTIVMQYLLQLAKSLDVDPRGCITGFYRKFKNPEKEYMVAYEDEVQSLLERVEGRAKARIEAAEEEARQAEEEERKKRLGPGGLDPVDVFEALPPTLQKCFEDKDIDMLKVEMAKLPKEDAEYHLKRCIDSGMWVPDAKSQAKEAAVAINSDDEEYEEVK